MRRFFGLVFTAMLVSGAPMAALAQSDPFKDLPGVKEPQAQDDRQPQMVCTSQLERQRANRYRNGLAYRTYRCESGDLSVESTRPPNEIDWKKSQDRYKPWINDGF